MTPVRDRSLTIAAEDGTGLHVRVAVPADASAGTAVVLHGASDHGGRLRKLSGALAAAGWRTACPDLRGHGLSDGPRVHVGRFEDYLTDLDRVVDAVAAPGESVAVVGVSLGGLIAGRFLQTRPERVRSAALVCPLFGFGFRVPDPLLRAGRWVARVRPETRLSSPARSGNATSPRFVTAGWFVEIERAIAAAWREAGPTRPNVHLMQSTADEVVDADATRAWADRLGRVATFETVAGADHDVLDGPHAREVVATLVDRLREASPASGSLRHAA